MAPGGCRGHHSLRARGQHLARGVGCGRPPCCCREARRPADRAGAAEAAGGIARSWLESIGTPAAVIVSASNPQLSMPFSRDFSTWLLALLCSPVTSMIRVRVRRAERVAAD